MPRMVQMVGSAASGVNEMAQLLGEVFRYRDPWM